MAERENLEVESGAGPDDAAERRKPGNQDGRHREQSLFGTVRKIQHHQHRRGFWQGQLHTLIEGLVIHRILTPELYPDEVFYGIRSVGARTAVTASRLRARLDSPRKATAIVTNGPA